MYYYRYRALAVRTHEGGISYQVEKQWSESWIPFWFHDEWANRCFYSWDAAATFAYEQGVEEKRRRRAYREAQPRKGQWWP